MGLPIWRDPEETKTKAKDNGPSKPPNPSHRVISSRIQRRASIHGPRSRAREAQRRQRFLDYPPSLPPINNIVHIPTLLEPVDSNAAPPPAPEPTRSGERHGLTQDPDERGTWSRARRIGQRRRLLEDTNRVTSIISRPPRTLPSAEPGENPAQFEIRTANEIMNALIGNSLPTPPTEGPTESQSHVESRIDGLGDRNRSPTPADASQGQESWSPLQSTITPDTTLPSAHSSFTSAEASNSFTASTPNTSVTEDEAGTSRQDNRSNSTSVSSIDADDLCADDDEEESGMLSATEALARDFYIQEFETPEGRERIARQQSLHATEGNRFALADEAPSVDVGFRLIEAALERIEEHQRDVVHGEEYTEALTRLARLSDSNRMRRRGGSSTAAVQADAEISTDSPQAHPVIVSSQPTPSSLNEMMRDADAGGHGEDLDAMRLIVERLAARDDVPEEWWMSMGLNLSRSRPRRTRRFDRAMNDLALANNRRLREARLHAESANRRIRLARAGEDRDRESRL